MIEKSPTDIFPAGIYLLKVNNRNKLGMKCVLASFCGKVKHELQVTSLNPRVTSSNLRVTSSNPRVTSSNPRVTSSNSRVRTLKARVASLKTRVGRLKARVGRLKARVRILKARIIEIIEFHELQKALFSLLSEF